MQNRKFVEFRFFLEKTQRMALVYNCWPEDVRGASLVSGSAKEAASGQTKLNTWKMRNGHLWLFVDDEMKDELAGSTANVCIIKNHKIVCVSYLRRFSNGPKTPFWALFTKDLFWSPTGQCGRFQIDSECERSRPPIVLRPQTQQWERDETNHSSWRLGGIQQSKRLVKTFSRSRTSPSSPAHIFMKCSRNWGQRNTFRKTGCVGLAMSSFLSKVAHCFGLGPNGYQGRFNRSTCPRILYTLSKGPSWQDEVMSIFVSSSRQPGFESGFGRFRVQEEWQKACRGTNCYR